MTEKPKDPSSETEVRIYSLATMMTESIIFLEEINGNRLLPIWIGTVEGQAIAIRFSGIVLPRPLTHDLTLSIIKTLGFTVEKIIITDLKENTFYASIYVKNGGAVHIIDSRPSDALAIAVRAGCSIFIREAIFSHAQVLSKPISEDEVQKFKDELKDLKPQDIFKNLSEKNKTEPEEKNNNKEKNDKEENEE